MEHELTDRLLLLAERYYDDIETLTSQEFADVEVRAAGLPDIISVERRGNGARLIRKGHDVTNDDGEVVEQLSPYWRVFQHHNATIGPPGIQENFATGVIDIAHLVDHAQRNATLYSRYLKWEAILRNLVLNELIASEHGLQLEVHYRWLSAFAHPTQTGYEIIERECGHSSWGARHRSHLLSELVVLYAATFVADELHSFCEFVDKPRPAPHAAESVGDRGGHRPGAGGHGVLLVAWLGADRLRPSSRSKPPGLEGLPARHRSRLAARTEPSVHPGC